MSQQFEAGLPAAVEPAPESPQARVELNASAPLKLEQKPLAYVIAAGHADLFFVSAAGARHHVARFTQGQTLFGELGDDDFTGYARVQYLLFTGMVDNFLGQVRLGQGDYEGAMRLFTGGLATARRAQDRILVLASLYDLALSSHAQGDLAGASGYLGCR